MAADAHDLAAHVAAGMPQLQEELASLVAIPGISRMGLPGAHASPAPRGARGVDPAVSRRGSRAHLEPRAAEHGADPHGRDPGPGRRADGAPLRPLRRRPAGEEELWESPPFEASERDGAIYGRGAADSKSNLLVHVGALRAWDGRPPVGVKILLEGQEEVGSVLEEGYPSEHPELFAADAILVADGGSIRAGQPSLTVSLRGDARITVETRTLASNKHSGQYGGAAPDALVVLLTALASLWDESGDVSVEGLRREEWQGESYTDDEFRSLAEIEEGMPIVGTGGIGSKIWSGPGITVLGIDCPAVDGAPAAVQSHARAVLNVRVHPEQPAAEAQAVVMRHLEALRPFGVPLTVTAGATGDGFRASSSGPAWDAMVAAMSTAWGADTVEIATGGAIPLVKAMSLGVPDASMFVFGATDSFANIHGPNERVLVDEWQKATVAEAVFFGELARRWKGERGE